MDEISAMLSPTAQEYYSNSYIEFQKTIANPDSKFFADYNLICDVISGVTGVSNIVDIGSGSCRWFSLFEDKVNCYFAIEANMTALGLAPKSKKIVPINRNIFDANFNLNDFTRVKIDSVLFGFFLSHFSDDVIESLVKKLSTVNKIIVIDSFWGPIHREKYKSKELREIKRVFSDVDRIVVPKRYFDTSDMIALFEPFGFSIKTFVNGSYWFVCIVER